MLLTACHLSLQAEVNQGLQEGLDVLKQQKALAEALSQTRGEEVQGLKQQIASLTSQLTEAQDRVQQAEIIRRKLHNTILVRHENMNRSMSAVISALLQGHSSPLLAVVLIIDIAFRHGSIISCTSLDTTLH